MSHASNRLAAVSPARIHQVFIACAAALIIASQVIGQEAGSFPIPPQMSKLDDLTNGKYMEYLKAIAISGHSGDVLEKQFALFSAVSGKFNNEAREAYIELIIQDIEDKRGFLAASAPKSVLLETLVREDRPGGRLEGVFLDVSAVRDKVGNPDGGHNALDDVEKPSTMLGWSSWGSQLWQKVDFRFYQAFLESHTAEYAARLIEYMLLRDPALALDILLEVYPNEFHDALAVRRERNVVEDWLWLERARGVVEEPDQATIDALESLGAGPDWWTRLYVLSWAQHRHHDRPYARLNAWFYKRSNLIVSLYEDERPVVRLVARQYAEKAGLMEKIEQR